MEQRGEAAAPPVFSSFSMSQTPHAPAFAAKTPKPPALARLSQQEKPKFSNSTNSLFIDETPSAPDCKELTRCAAKAVAALLAPQAAALGEGGVFDERRHPLVRNADLSLPPHDRIYSFVRHMYKKTRMQPECVVMMVGFVEKLLGRNAASLALTSWTWRRVCIAALVVANKVFEDYAVWTADFLSLFPLSNIDDLNALEREFLNLVGFETAFGASDYARYYFALRELSDHKDQLPQTKPLTDAQTRRLELVARELSKEKDPALGRSFSLHVFPGPSGAQSSSASSDGKSV